MKLFTSLVVLLIASTSQAQICSQSWTAQDETHVSTFRTKLDTAVKRILIMAYSRVNIQITEENIDFETEIFSRTVHSSGGISYVDTIIGYSRAHVKIGESTTDYIVSGSTAVDSANPENKWLVRTYLGIDTNYTPIGDVKSYICHSSAQTIVNLMPDSKFKVARATNGYVVGTTYPLISPDLSEEIK